MKFTPGLELLVLSPIPTYPFNYGNRRRIYQQLATFKERGARITFVYYASSWQSEPYLSEHSLRMMASQWDSFFVVHPTVTDHKPQGAYHQLDSWWDPSLEGFLKWIFQKRSFDAVIVNYIWLSKAFEFCPYRTLKVLDTHDRMSGRKELLQKHGVKPEFFYLDKQSEAQGLSRADLVWAIKDTEAQIFREMCPGVNVMTFPHAEDFGRALPKRYPDEVMRFGIIGAANSINVVNTRNFLKEALPWIRLRATPLTIVLAGEFCFQLNEFEAEDVSLLGPVDSIEEFYDQVDVVLAPIEFSTGMKIKVGEAVASGKPIIGHRDAFDGYPAVHKFHQCDSFSEMADACCAVANQPELLSELEDATQTLKDRWKNTVNLATDRFLSETIAHTKSALIIPPPDFHDKNSFAYHRLLEVIQKAFRDFRIIIVSNEELPLNFLKDLRCFKKEVFIARTLNAAFHHLGGQPVAWTFHCAWVMDTEIIPDIKSLAPNLFLLVDLVCQEIRGKTTGLEKLAQTDALVSASLVPAVLSVLNNEVFIASALQTFWLRENSVAWDSLAEGKIVYVLAPQPSNAINQYLELLKLAVGKHFLLRLVIDDRYEYKIDLKTDRLSVVTIQSVLGNLRSLARKPYCCVQLGAYLSNPFHALADIFQKKFPYLIVDPAAARADLHQEDLAVTKIASLSQLLTTFSLLFSGQFPLPDKDQRAVEWSRIRNRLAQTGMRVEANRRLSDPFPESLQGSY